MYCSSEFVLFNAIFYILLYITIQTEVNEAWQLIDLKEKLETPEEMEEKGITVNKELVPLLES